RERGVWALVGSPTVRPSAAYSPVGARAGTDPAVGPRLHGGSDGRRGAAAAHLVLAAPGAAPLLRRCRRRADRAQLDPQPPAVAPDRRLVPAPRPSRPRAARA